MKMTSHPARLTSLAALTLCCLFAFTACTIQISGISTTSQGPSTPTSIPVKIAQGTDGSTLILVSVKINKSGPYTFALDTGASVSAIDRDLANKLNLPATGGPQTVSGVGGQQQEIPVRIKTWNAETIHLPATTVGSLKLFSDMQGSGLQGLIGSDVWRQFGQITINYSAGQLTVAHQVAESSQSANVLSDATLPERRLAFVA